MKMPKPKRHFEEKVLTILVSKNREYLYGTPQGRLDTTPLLKGALLIEKESEVKALKEAWSLPLEERRVRVTKTIEELED